MALDINTKILTFSGEILRAADLKQNDVLIGPDSLPRRIKSIQLVESKERYLIKPVFGNSFIASSDQVLLLKKSIYLERNAHLKKLKYSLYPNPLPLQVGDIYATQSSSFNKCWFLGKTALDYQSQPVPIDPYFLGLWLGDGSSNVIGITSMDAEVIQKVHQQAEKYGLNVTINRKKDNLADTYIITRGNIAGFGKKKNILLNHFHDLNLIKNKHIPKSYLINSDECRLQVLAGLIDSDGDFGNNVFYISQKSKVLTDQIVQLANSLGFRSYSKPVKKKIHKIGFSGDYFSITISGPIDRIPTRLSRKQADQVSKKHNRKNTGFIVEKLNEGFCLSIATDQDNCYLLADGTAIGGEGFAAPPFSSYRELKRELIWDDNLTRLVQFIKHSKRYPRIVSNGQERTLACWLANVRVEYRDGTLSSQRLDKLIANGLTLAPSMTRMYANLQLIRSYIHIFKKTPGYYTIFRGVKIGRWWSRYKKKIDPALMKSIYELL